MLGGDFLKAFHDLARRFRISFSLVSARPSKLRRSVIESERQGFLKGRNRFVVALELRIQEAVEVKRIRLVRCDLLDMLKRVDCLFGLAQVFKRQAQVVPSIRILGKFCGSFVESRARWLELLLPKQRNAEIQFRLGEMR